MIKRTQSRPPAGSSARWLVKPSKQPARWSGNKDVAREGRLQQAQVDAEAVLSGKLCLGFWATDGPEGAQRGHSTS